ncbi:hypothetical protein IAQ61_011363 [Plenodomus lingam]|uniref:Uncharacterized protein n=1 Tax=Leptosphaeria maculans (strain JN3 / isolate v23.1.3 / race Av1-4-5-6-7-8) TaxID=985895 RepID=E5A9U6_LEPMJ|nr:hypothetical protein LEMA_P015670.1 [Plenodomus lingam JN3]KAH9859582.1 hypothetical protein IAQ61_011363 [Plenodomus lingam]CBY00437.1 hypothetical protein LEMA_P015670.1 [Plenodomus lingam JN3]
MTLLQTLLRATAFKNPLLRTLVPSVALAYGIQTAVAVPSIAAQTERYYDLSGSLTYLSCTALSLFLPYLRAQSAGAVTGGLAEYLSSRGLGQGTWWWRQALLSAAVGIWATRLGSYLYQRISSDSGRDSRFDKIRISPPKFYIAFFAQATWVTLCTLPIILVNSLPRSAYAVPLVAGSQAAIAAKPYLTDLLGLALFAFGLTFEVVADRQKAQWVADKKAKRHSEEFLTHGLWAKSRHPNYFGEVTLWTGIALAAAGLLVRQPAQAALGLSGGLSGRVLVAGMCAASPAFVTFLLLKVSGVPLSEEKYDKRYGDRKDYKKWKDETPMFIPKF